MVWISQIGLGDAQYRNDTGVVGGNHGPVNKPGARLRIGCSYNNDQSVGISDHNALVGVGVVSCSAQYSVTLSKSHNTGQATFGSGGVTDDVDKVAGDDGGVAHFASTHRGNIARLGFGGVFGFATRRQIHGVSAPIYSRDPTGNSIFVSRTVFGARPAAAFWWTFWCRTL